MAGTTTTNNNLTQRISARLIQILDDLGIPRGLQDRSQFLAERLKVTAQEGVFMLSGSVDWSLQQLHAVACEFGQPIGYFTDDHPVRLPSDVRLAPGANGFGTWLARFPADMHRLLPEPGQRVQNVLLRRPEAADDERPCLYVIVEEVSLHADQHYVLAGENGLEVMLCREIRDGKARMQGSFGFAGTRIFAIGQDGSPDILGRVLGRWSFEG